MIPILKAITIFTIFVTSVNTFAVAIGNCSSELSPDAGYLPNKEALESLARFPNEEIRQKDKYSRAKKQTLEIWKNSKNTQEDLWSEMELKLRHAISESNIDLIPYNYLPTTILQKGDTLEAQYSPNFEALVNLAVV